MSTKHNYYAMADYRCPECGTPLMWVRAVGNSPILFHSKPLGQECERTNAQYRAPQESLEVINEE